MIEDKSEQYWKILNGQCKMREALEILDFKPESIDEIMNDRDPMGFLVMGITCSQSAYSRLHELGKIDTERVFNIGTNKYSEGDDRPMDYGIKDNEMYFYNGKYWELYN